MRIFPAKNEGGTAVRTPRIHYLLLALYALSGLYLLRNLQHPFLWFDEAVQFFISKGKDPFSGAGTGSWMDLLQLNAYYNLDPGGFGALLRLWSGISDHHIWLRALPFLFFALSIFAFVGLLNLLTADRTSSLFLGFLPFFVPAMLTAEAFEIRAYSMEVLSLILICQLLVRAKTISNAGIFMLSTAIAVLVSSRYSAFVDLALAVPLTVAILRQDAGGRRAMLRVLLFLLPLLCSLAVVFFFSFQWQNPQVKALEYLPYLKYRPDILLKPHNLIYLLAVFAGIPLLIRHAVRKGDRGWLRILLYVFMLNLVFLVLSFSGHHPWDAGSHRSISMVMATVLAYAYPLHMLLRFYVHKDGRRKYELLVPVLAVMLYANPNLNVWKDKQANIYNDLFLLESGSYDRIFVDPWFVPSLRYTYEYDRVPKERLPIYPDVFRFTRTYHVPSVFHGEPLEQEVLDLKDFSSGDVLMALSPARQFTVKGEKVIWVRIGQSSNLWMLRAD
ncbi:MAG: hypothetical protein H6606_11040 [Flavobacteriales bacterium]|nr:hypothetical protein [Flavobacteriales bacterium]